MVDEILKMIYYVKLSKNAFFPVKWDHYEAILQHFRIIPNGALLFLLVLLLFLVSPPPDQKWNRGELNSSSMEPTAFTHSSSLTRFPFPLKATLRLNSLLLQPTTLPIHTTPRRSVHLLTKSACENHSHHHHHHRHCCSVGQTASNYPQKVLIEFAKAIGWVRLANFLREHLHLCCSSAVLFIAAAACPYLIPKTYIKPLQNSFMIVAFPLVGVKNSPYFFFFFFFILCFSSN